LSRSLYAELMYPFEAWQSISRNVLPYFSLVPRSEQDYRVALEECALKRISGGRVHDASACKPQQ
jgi:hypothetical protein